MNGPRAGMPRKARGLVRKHRSHGTSGNRGGAAGVMVSWGFRNGLTLLAGVLFLIAGCAFMLQLRVQDVEAPSGLGGSKIFQQYDQHKRRPSDVLASIHGLPPTPQTAPPKATAEARSSAHGVALPSAPRQDQRQHEQQPGAGAVAIGGIGDEQDSTVHLPPAKAVVVTGGAGAGNFRGMEQSVS
ncbi:unnamed protein product, partial [Pylaiella littoralis]